MRAEAMESTGGVGAFVRYDLRTTDPKAAANFYRAVAGLKVAEVDESPILMSGGPGVEDEGIVGRVEPLQERARAAGAPAHWLGHVAVTDVDACLERLADLGGERLGPLGEDREGRRFATVRDPQGAVFALSSGEPSNPAASSPTVAWHQLHTTDLDAAWTFYSELLGWRKTHTLELGQGIGTYQLFGWDGIEGSAGAMAGTARQPRVHTHWLFHLPVSDIDAAVEATREGGGSVVHGPTKVPGGSRVAACDDPQGGAFGLREG